MQRFLVLATILFLTPSAFANMRDSRTASLLANKIAFLSAHRALEFVDLYRDTVRPCIDRLENPNQQQRIDCSYEGIEAVNQAFIADMGPEVYAQRQMQERMRELRSAGHISTLAGIVPDLNYPSFGVAGDSLAVGSSAAEHIEAQTFKLWGEALMGYLGGYHPRRDSLVPLITGETVQPERVLRIYDSPGYRSGFFARSFENRASRFADCEECSYAYTVARNMGVPANNVFFAGQGGADIQELDNQLRRLALPLGHLPDTVLVSFTANSICGEHNADRTFDDRYEWYKRRMRSRLNEALSEVVAAPGGTKFYVVAAADVSNVLTNPKILNRPIYSYYPDGSFSRSSTCRDMRNGTHATTNGSGRDIVAGMCRYLMYTSPDDTERVEHIADLHAAVVKAHREVTEEFALGNQYPGVSFEFLDSILNVEFETEDVSPDCFHPSTSGHDKIADILLEEMGR